MLFRSCTTADGVRLAYAVSGEGPPLVMSQTWLTHLEHQWRSLAWRPWLDIFSREHKLLRHDSRGCGLSDRDVSDLSFETWVRDLEWVVEAASILLLVLSPLPRIRTASDALAIEAGGSPS